MTLVHADAAYRPSGRPNKWHKGGKRARYRAPCDTHLPPVPGCVMPEQTRFEVACILRSWEAKGRVLYGLT